MKRPMSSILLLLLFLSVDCQTIKYPTAHKVDSSDTYFGVKVNDPYRWLENDSSADTEELDYWQKTKSPMNTSHKFRFGSR